MRIFTDPTGRSWVASAREEATPRHHGRWYLILHPEADDASRLAVPEVRWQSRATAERTLRTMSTFELRRRLGAALARAGEAPPAAAPL
jgi:hypothetical protein